LELSESGKISSDGGPKKPKTWRRLARPVSGVAHDMKTPLVAIAGFARQVLKKMREGDPQREKLDIIHREAQRLESMVKDMLDYARPLDLRLAPTQM
jgi:two-component system, NtrC family, sensor histidine kinase HydH